MPDFFPFSPCRASPFCAHPRQISRRPRRWTTAPADLKLSRSDRMGRVAMLRTTRIILFAGAALAVVGGAYAAQQAAKPPSLTYSGPVPPQFLIDPQNGSKF